MLGADYTPIWASIIGGGFVMFVGLLTVAWRQGRLEEKVDNLCERMDREDQRRNAGSWRYGAPTRERR